MYSPSYAEGAGSAEEAVRGADVVVVATSSREPVLAHEWLSPGMHVNAVGASTPQCAGDRGRDGRRRCAVLRQPRVAAQRSGRVPARDRAGSDRPGTSTCGPSSARCWRASGRAAPGDDELTMFRSLGVAIEDLAAAQLAVAVARERGLGTEVEL